jgi:hypothetical protein
VSADLVSERFGRSGNLLFLCVSNKEAETMEQLHTIRRDEDVRTGYYHADMPGRAEPYLITYDADSHVTDFH